MKGDSFPPGLRRRSFISATLFSFELQRIEPLETGRSRTAIYARLDRRLEICTSIALRSWSLPGAKTGRTLVRPLCYSCDGDRLVIIASYGGAPRNPPWYHNLVANPVVTVEVGTERFKARATQVYGAERDRLFVEAAKLMPLFTDYQNKTKRQLPLLILTRILGGE